MSPCIAMSLCIAMSPCPSDVTMYRKPLVLLLRVLLCTGLSTIASWWWTVIARILPICRFGRINGVVGVCLGVCLGVSGEGALRWKDQMLN